ncbi:hypothetical protein G6F57_020758 [Rhizopus arrhizus]|nr:hypothetical protein G6F57_020758 [Rhizopus arrhizus]
MLLGIFGGNREPFFFGAPLVMHDRRRFLQTAACAALLGSAGTARALSVKQAMLSRAIPASGDSIPVIGLGTADTFNVSPGDTAAMEPLAQVLDIFTREGGFLIDTAPSYGQAEAVVGSLLAGHGGVRDRCGSRKSSWAATNSI